jgi:hypothetical protein
MRAERIKQVNDELLRRTGVDFSRYRNQELVDAVANAVTFPLFFARSVSRSVGAFLLAVCVGIVAEFDGNEIMKTGRGSRGVYVQIRSRRICHTPCASRSL